MPTIEPRRVAASLASAIDAVHRHLEETAHEIPKHLSLRDGLIDAPTPAAVKWIHSRAQDLLTNHTIVHGAGVILNIERAVIPRQCILWQIREGEGFTDYQFDLEGSGTNVYDYRQQPWYATPNITNRPATVGPYLDYAGVDEFIVTLTAPYLDSHGMVALGGADLAVESLQQRLLSETRGTSAEFVLANSEGRILGANTAQFLPGEKIDEHSNLSRILLPTAIPAFTLWWADQPG